MKVLIFYQRGWAIRFGIPICSAIKYSFPDAQISALVMKQTAFEHIQKQNSINFENIWIWDKYLHAPDEVIGDRTVSLREVCDFLGVEGIWENVQSLRAHIRDYGKRYYYAYSQSVSDEHLTKIIYATYLLVKEIHEKFKPDAIIVPNFVGIQHLFFMHYCRKYNVYIRGFTDSRFDRSRVILIENELDDGGPVHEKFKNILQSRSEPSKHCKEIFLNFKNNLLAKTKAKSSSVNYGLLDKPSLKRIASQVYRKFKRTNQFYKSVVSIDNSGVRIAIRDHLTHYKNVTDVNSFKYDEVPNAPFVFFPLQFQPEQTIDVFSPFFNNQIETARLVAMSLPYDVTLVVKDHPAMVGYRNASYLQKIQTQPNIKLVDYRVSSAKLISESIGVISPGGTVILEAAFVGKKAIQLGDNAIYTNFSHVLYFTHLRELRRQIATWFYSPIDQKLADFQILAWIQAVLDKGIDMDYFSAWEAKEKFDITPMTDAIVSDMKQHFKGDN